MLFKDRFFKKDKKELPEYLWQKCNSCGEILHKNQLQKNFWVCPACGFHFRINSKIYISILTDDGKLTEEILPSLSSKDPLNFPKYSEKIKESQKKTNIADASVAGKGRIGGRDVFLFITDFEFMGGSMGSVMGQKFYITCKRAIEQRHPVIAIFSSGGGARMQEGIISLMQMVKTNIGVYLLHKNSIPYITVLCNPTMAGVMASFAALGDVSLAEPKALLGFTGPRVIQQTIGEKLPEGFQTSEFQLQHGMIDAVVDRRNLKETLCILLSILCANL